MAQYGNPYGSDSGQQNYGGYGAQSYGQASPYGGSGYADSRNDAQGYGQASPYGGGGYADPGNDVEMAPMGSSNAASILDECRAIDGKIDTIEHNLAQLQHLQAQTLGDVSAGGASSRQLDDLSADTMALYRSLTPRVRALKSDPASSHQRNAAQVSRVDKRLKEAITKYQSVEASFQHNIQDQIARQYRIVRPDADEAEVRGAVEDTRGEVFQRALMQSGRQGQASAALSAVQDRHDQIRKIERQMAELAQLFQDMNAVVVQQGAGVQRIEDLGEDARQNLAGGTQKVSEAVDIGRAARKKKWICAGIVVLIIIIIIAVVLAILASQNLLKKSGGGGGNKS